MAKTAFDEGVKHLGVGSGWFAEQLTSKLQGLPLFAECSSEEIAFLASFMRIYRAEPGIAIIHEGEHSDFMMVLLEGRVKVTKTSAEGEETVIATVSTGQTLGEMAIIEELPRSATCTAIETTTFAALTRESLELVLRGEPVLGVKMLKQLATILSQRLRNISTDFVEFV